MKKFEVNTEVTARSVCDHNCVWTAVVLKRTPKTVTVKMDNGDVKTCRIQDRGEGEYIFPLGVYSMAPVMRAS
jgi:hypothetical protein